jgi:hypothetical protein
MANKNLDNKVIEGIRVIECNSLEKVKSEITLGLYDGYELLNISKEQDGSFYVVSMIKYQPNDRYFYIICQCDGQTFSFTKVNKKSQYPSIAELQEDVRKTNSTKSNVLGLSIKELNYQDFVNFTKK